MQLFLLSLFLNLKLNIQLSHTKNLFKIKEKINNLNIPTFKIEYIISNTENAKFVMAYFQYIIPNT
jgi:hypothetical protein